MGKKSGNKIIEHPVCYKSIIRSIRMTLNSKYRREQRKHKMAKTNFSEYYLTVWCVKQNFVAPLSDCIINRMCNINTTNSNSSSIHKKK